MKVKAKGQVEYFVYSERLYGEPDEYGPFNAVDARDCFESIKPEFGGADIHVTRVESPFASVSAGRLEKVVSSAEYGPQHWSTIWKRIADQTRTVVGWNVWDSERPPGADYSVWRKGENHYEELFIRELKWEALVSRYHDALACAVEAKLEQLARIEMRLTHALESIDEDRAVWRKRLKKVENVVASQVEAWAKSKVRRQLPELAEALRAEESKERSREPAFEHVRSIAIEAGMELKI